ncbi:MAG: hypothetical protein KKC75_07890 [Nanoarchaeota archaeon]|nr:hypothetical protein [Nanoarchaeota archaeon]MBU1004739.1 hypothetical protein [Nanoarchaeota archaeon]MBU1945688.1 hypothetical protein [Nanoarchaeota archaeon]
MKKITLLFLILFLVNSVYAVCDITDTLTLNDAKKYNEDGKDYNITFYSTSNTSSYTYFKFKVNGDLTSNLELGDKYQFDDLSEIMPESIVSYNSTSKSVQICFNAGLSTEKSVCSSNNDCNDNNTCTLDECDGDPLKCHHKLILWCRDDDSCCPSRCTVEQDNDCQVAANLSNDSQNNTNQSSTLSTGECLSGDDLCPQQCNFTVDKDCDECSSNESCSDDNPCTLDICSGTPKKCYNNSTSTCPIGNDCIPIGTKTKDQFCSTENKMKSLKTKAESCINNYECISDKCVKNKCKSQPLSTIIKNWFSKLFNR